MVQTNEYRNTRRRVVRGIASAERLIVEARIEAKTADTIRATLLETAANEAEATVVEAQKILGV